MKKIEEKKILLGTFTAGNGLKKALAKKPDAVIKEVTDSGLKGRGGAGFPCGLKWKFTAGEKAKQKYIVCNADEGEPGTFKDRVLLLDHAAKLFEGMAIAGYAVGAAEGVIYLRGEYTYMLPELKEVREEMKKKKLLGKKILGKKFDFDISIKMGAGAYVCGEEFALIESMNGMRGEPRNKPPFPAQQGYLEKPTVVNNVETLCSVPHILEKGAAWYKKLGVKESTGTKLFSISGDVKKPGVYEFEMGITLKEMLKHVGGEKAKAVQVAGAAGINVPAKEFGRKLAYGDLPPSGSIIVFGEDRDMLHVLKNFMEFFVEESCGQCTPCREGNYQLLRGLEMIEKGECSVRYLKELKNLCVIMRDASKCGLGQSAPNPFETILENFKDEILYK